MGEWRHWAMHLRAAAEVVASERQAAYLYRAEVHRVCIR